MQTILDFLMPVMLMFSTPSLQPVVPPRDPSLDDEAQRRRLDAERAAVAESKAAGRQSTIVGGARIAADEQANRNKRKATTDLLGA